MAKASKRSIDESDQRNPQLLSNLSDDHDFLAPNEICSRAIGFFYWMTKKYLCPISFSALYEQHSSDLIKELVKMRENLQPNIISVGKCLIINRLITNYQENPDDFYRRFDDLYRELKMYMSSVIPSPWTEQDQCAQVLKWQELQVRRRLFYCRRDDGDQLQTLLTLQRAATKLCAYLIMKGKHDPMFWQQEGRDRFINLIHHSFIIVAHPTGPQCHTATQYRKGRVCNTHSAPLHARVICLLDGCMLNTVIQLSTIDVKLHPRNDPNNEKAEVQPSLQWKKRTIISSEGQSLSFLYFELDSIVLQQLDAHGKCPFYNTLLCQVQFRTTFHLIQPALQFQLLFSSEPFDIYSHSDYFPECTGKLFLMEMEQTLSARMTPENQIKTLTNMINGYHILVAGVEPNETTLDFVKKVLQAAYDKSDQTIPQTIFEIYQETLAKLITQIKSFALYPMLSLFYHDGFFLGVCDPALDEQLQGTRDQPHIYLRFNSLDGQKTTENAIVRYIAHPGELIRAKFEMKIFPHDICRLIYESDSPQAEFTRMFLGTTFQDFQLYFDAELYRISQISHPTQSKYNPLVPILWDVMRRRNNFRIQLTEPGSTAHSMELNTTLSYSGYLEKFGAPSDYSTNRQYVVDAAIDPLNAGKVTMTIQFVDHNVQCDDELIELISRKLRELCYAHGNRNNGQ